MLITARSLTKAYRMSRDNVVVALAGVDLDVQRGELIAIVGPSGSGKSTLLNILGTLDGMTAGSLRIGEVDIDKSAPSRLPQIRADSIGFIFQEFNLIPTLSALENVMLGLRYLGVRKSEARRRSLEYLDLVGLSDRVRHKPRELSGGQQQRVAIARALVKEPAFVLGDEPTGELDTHTTAEIIALLKRINREKGVAMILVTHNPEVARQADRVIAMRDGRIEAAAPDPALA